MYVKVVVHNEFVLQWQRVNSTYYVEVFDRLRKMLTYPRKEVSTWLLLHSALRVQDVHVTLTPL